MAPRLERNSMAPHLLPVDRNLAGTLDRVVACPQHRKKTGPFRLELARESRMDRFCRLEKEARRRDNHADGESRVSIGGDKTRPQGVALRGKRCGQCGRYLQNSS